MRKGHVIVLTALLACGCLHEDCEDSPTAPSDSADYACADGSVVSDPENCPSGLPDDLDQPDDDDPHTDPDDPDDSDNGFISNEPYCNPDTLAAIRDSGGRHRSIWSGHRDESLQITTQCVAAALGICYGPIARAEASCNILKGFNSFESCRPCGDLP